MKFKITMIPPKEDDSASAPAAAGDKVEGKVAAPATKPIPPSATVKVKEASGRDGGEYKLGGEGDKPVMDVELDVQPGTTISVSEAGQELEYDQAQKAAVPAKSKEEKEKEAKEQKEKAEQDAKAKDWTPTWASQDPSRPGATPPPPKKDEAGHATGSGSSIKPNNVVDPKPATSPLPKR